MDSNHLSIVTAILTIVDKLSEVRFIVSIHQGHPLYAFTFIGTMAVAAVCNIVILLQTLHRLVGEDYDASFRSYLQTRRTTVACIFTLSLLRFDCIHLVNE